MNGKESGPKGEIPLTLTKRERDLLLAEAGRGLGIEPELRALAPQGGKYVFRFILEDWEEIAGFLTRSAAKASDRKRVDELDRLIDRIEDLVDEHFDEPGSDADDGEPDEVFP
jgi:hypothetical protein